MMNKFRLYKPNRDGKGCASQWELSPKTVKVGRDQKSVVQYVAFLQMAAQGERDQDGNDRFDWEKAITVKLGAADLGEIIAVLDGRKESVGSKGSLYHETPGGGNKVVELKWVADSNAYGLRVSAQDAQKNAFKLQHMIGLGEASILSTLLKAAIVKMHGWDEHNEPLEK